VVAGETGQAREIVESGEDGCIGVSAFPGADDLGNVFRHPATFNAGRCASRDVALSRSLDPGLQSFEERLARNPTRVPIQ